MATTIQISNKLMEELKEKKMSEKESYEDVIWNLLEDSMELSAETKKEIEQARKEIAQGKFHTHEEVKRKLGL